MPTGYECLWFALVYVMSINIYILYMSLAKSVDNTFITRVRGLTRRDHTHTPDRGTHEFD